MKLNKIISTALIFVLLFSAIISVTPLMAAAEETNTVVTEGTTEPDAELTLDDIKVILEAYKKHPGYSSAKEMLEADKAAGYIYSVNTAEYSIHVNKYTGVSYYENNLTGQILTSNPIDPGYSGVNVDLDEGILSQVELIYFENSNPGVEIPYNSFNWIKQGSTITVAPLDKGFSVSYILGEAVSALIAPGAILGADLESQVIGPMFDAYAALMQEYFGDYDGSIKVNGTTYDSYDILGDNNKASILRHGAPEKIYVTYAVDAFNAYAKAKLNAANKGVENYDFKKDAKYKKLNQFSDQILNFFEAYIVMNLNNPNFDRDKYAVYLESITALEPTGGYAFTLKENATLTERRFIDRALKYCLPSFTKDNADALEANAGYSGSGIVIPAFTCTINYLLDEDGHLIVDFPANAIDYEEDVFTLKSITPIKYFGCADMTKDGYAFYPDGSGTVIKFSDFYSETTKYSINVTAKVYGQDYGYSSISGKRREQVVMPVYGIVNETPANPTTATLTGKDTVTNGFFAVLDEGASLAELGITSGGSVHKYAFSYASYTPYPADKYNLADTMSVGGSVSYYIVSESKYEGSYKTRITMLSDPDVAAATPTLQHYDTSYVGMAQCYREYLKSKGILTALENVSEDNDLPLYIEALGSIDVMKKVLTFPVTVSTPLTTFEDIKTMYAELSNAVAKLNEKQAEYERLANELEAQDTTGKEAELISRYRAKAARYAELATEIVDIKNVNFKLTGFANGGMYFTYPAKVKWEKSLGGKKGFNDLLATSKAYKDDSDINTNLGIYPEFDFAFINNTANFDGISKGSSAAKMVDNRYASKQVFNSITGEYDQLFALVVSTDALDGLYTKFLKKYTKYDATCISVSTLGSVLNSNFDEDNSINREEALVDVTALLDRMAADYSVMTDIGNVYAMKYVDHVINATIDSSHLAYSSYAVPFYGMVLHGYVNYAGTPINYSGSPDYNILRSIENGANLFYILCKQNTSYLKEDENFSKYYGVDYENWFDKLVEQYAVLNEAIGKYQKYEIVYHSTILSERVIDKDEKLANNKRLMAEYVSVVDSKISAFVDAAFEAMKQDPANIGKGVSVSIDRDSLIDKAVEIMNIDEQELLGAGYTFASDLDAVIAKYVNEYPAKADATVVSFGGAEMVYTSQYDYVTDSVTGDENYDYTDFTCDNSNVVMVVYQDNTVANGDKVVFLLNYNMFSVDITIDNRIDPNLADGETRTITLEKHGYGKITSEEGR